MLFGNGINWLEQKAVDDWTDHFIDNFSSPYAPWAGDLNGDGKLDIIVAKNNEWDLYLLEGVDGVGSFNPPTLIGENDLRPMKIHAVDVDQDDDQDLVLVLIDPSTFFLRIVWRENTDALGNLGEEQLIGESFGSTFSVSIADMDGDGDLDVTGNGGSHQIVWFENPNITAVAPLERGKPQISVYPNPSLEFATFEIKGLEAYEQYQLCLSNLSGQKLQHYPVNTFTNTRINIDQLPKGMYIYQLINNTNQQVMTTGKLIVVDAP